MENISITDSPDTATWEQFVAEHPKGTIFHTPQMVAAFRAAAKHEPLVLAAVKKDGKIVALLVAVRVKTLPDPLGAISSRSIFYAEPICRTGEGAACALELLIAEHDRRMRRKVLFTEVRPFFAAGDERAALERCSYTFEPYLNFLVDLTVPLDELMLRMSSSCRAHIRHGLRRGIYAMEATSPEALESVYNIVGETYARAHVPLADKSLFEAVYALAPSGSLNVTQVFQDSMLIGGAILLSYRERVLAWYYGTQRCRSCYAAECLIWHNIEWAQRNGYKIFDFGGAGWPDRPYGVREFKAKFGGERVCYGRYRKIYSPWKFTIAEKSYEAIRHSAAASLLCGKPQISKAA
ncbi:MAG: lipid II:glycine glycyltransferase FemX [Terriglobales bacterium]